MLNFIFFGLTLLLLGIVLRYLKINKNYFFGYRTFSSLKTDRSWRLANKTAGTHYIIIGLASSVIGLLCFYFKLCDFDVVIFSTLAVFLLSLIVIEIKLFRFNKELPKKSV